MINYLRISGPTIANWHRATNPDGASLELWQKEVQGYIELVWLSDKIAIYCNEEGKIKQLDPVAAWVDPKTEKILDILCGPIVIVRVDSEGNDASLVYEEDMDIIKQNIRPLA